MPGLALLNRQLGVAHCVAAPSATVASAAPESKPNSTIAVATASSKKLLAPINVALGHWFPIPFQVIGRAEAARVNLPVAVLIWLMIIPMLLKIDIGALHQVREHWRGIGVTLFINWAVKPFSMALLGWLFIGVLFRQWLPANQIDSYIAGLII